MTPNSRRTTMRAKGRLVFRLAASGALLLVACALLARARAAYTSTARVSASPPPPFDAHASWYGARGTGTITVDGPGCCDGVPLTGAFEMEYDLDAAGQPRITRLAASPADIDLTFRFLIFETGRIQLRCGAAQSDAVIYGNLDASGNLNIPTGAATLSGHAYDKRDASGECSGAMTSITLTNNAPLTGLLDPLGNRVGLAGSFTMTTGGNTYDITLDMTGEYTNRPPVAVFGVEGARLEAFAQGGCPATPGSGNPPEPVVEANDAAGLRMYLRSFSHDPEGAWSGSDLRLDQWFHARDDADLKFIGESRRLGPLVFEFGPLHHLALRTTDRTGASALSPCVFRVVDRTPPMLTPPAPTVVSASVAGGATPDSSAALRAFLKRATATDIADPAPVVLAPLLADGTPITGDTLFGVDPPGEPEEWRTVVFRFTDRFGNVGQASSSVRVVAPGK